VSLPGRLALALAWRFRFDLLAILLIGAAIKLKLMGGGQ
jgi:hypothetical protein